MNTPIEFYTHPMSRGRMVRWMLEEIGVEYTEHIVEYGRPMKAPEYVALNPMGKVPIIKHGNMVVSESAAICAYLADAFPDSQLAPAIHSPLRGTYYRWLFFTAGPIEAASTAKQMDALAHEEFFGMAGYGRWKDVLTTIEFAIQEHAGPYLCGQQFTAADLYLAAQLNWLMYREVIKPTATIVDYAAPLAERPAAVRANEMDNLLMEQYPVDFA